MSKKAVLLINLGTPDDAHPKSVRKYLKEFLNDPRVIDLPGLLRWFLVNFIIIPLRYKKSAHAYQKIWATDGSPLLTATQKMTQALANELGPDYQVDFAMRYRKPSIQSILKKFHDAESISVVPLFPQYSSAATGSAIEKFLKSIVPAWNIPKLHITRDFYNDAGFIRAYAEKIKQSMANKNIDVIVFSYHGLPERHIAKSACQAACDHSNACPAIDVKNLYCYRAQCYATTELIAKELNLQPHQYRVAFQSRLGRTPWIKPYTDLLLPELRQQGVNNIAIVSPSFIADCLETLEEIDIRTREQWQQLGGKDFTFIPCVNDSALWIKALADIVTQNHTEVSVQQA